MNEEYYLKSFISGLKEELQYLVMVQRPMTLSQAFTIAKLQESVMEKMKASSRTSRGSYQNPQSLRAIRPAPAEPASKVTLLDNSAAITKRLSNDEVEDRRKRGLCFHCDERDTFGHKCKKIFNIEGFEEGFPDADQPPGQEDLEHQPQVSLNALDSRITPETIKVMGKVRNNTISILVDTGSTHSFLDPHSVRRMNCGWSVLPTC